ncbi:GNAT family N-acetyltransferase [Streptomyces sp. PT12]|uniref:GNAT family N-acetyltransferase n=1 Tax=Streptomyces sp. PT12 TaxID=1510197 RepID=UPI000DE49DCD|nr:GNAT family N-acetyltransferase [Streptomyces sp. PT12]RBM07319.1 GNAT family N-acetyltransferase [Streptomyces sp. PT12]
MRLRWDWLRPVVTVPFVPTLGPVHPSVFTDDLFRHTLEVAPSRRFLRYDKDVRWSESKEETILTGDVIHGPGETLIPTITRRGSGTVKLHVYSVRPDSAIVATELAQKLSAIHGTATARVVHFLGPETPHARGTRIQLKNFPSFPCHKPDGPVRPFAEWPVSVQQSFGDFAQEMAADGFSFLYDQMQAGRVGPVLVAARSGKAVAAIGPMEIRPDAIGSPQLMPQYFGVLPEHRGKGLGRLLWRAAMHWGKSHGAAYQLLQTEVGGASDRLCQSEGLKSLGFVHSDHV